MAVPLPDPHEGWIHCLLHLYAELGRAGVSIDSLRPYQIQIISDLTKGVSEQALARMLDKNWYDQNEDIRQKIDLFVVMTSKGNLSVEWMPRHWRDGSGTGFREFDWSRPSNELLFVRGVADARRGLCRFRKIGAAASQADLVSQSLLITTAAAVRNLRERLEHVFDVSTINDVFLTWKSDELGETDSAPDELFDWEIESIEKQATRLELRELNRLATACPLGDLLYALHRSRQKKKTGPAPRGNDESVSRLLRNDGFSKMTPPAVGRYRELLRKHKAEALPEWDRPGGSEPGDDLA